MTGWRDDLPPIPTERIRTEAMREGFRRRERRAKRQRAVLYGGVGAAVVALFVVIAVQSERAPEEAGDGAAAEPTLEAPAATTEAAPATTAAPTEAPATAAPTEAPATTAPEATSATSAAAATTAPNYTTVSGSIAALPVSGDVIVTLSTIWEQASSGTECGPTTLGVLFRPQGVEVRSPVVHWEVAGVQGEAVMEVVGDTARATVGPFPADTLDADERHELLVYVIDPGVTDQEIYRARTVVLRDCST
jgi:hypothetical protein